MVAKVRPWLEALAVVALLVFGYKWYRQIGTDAVLRSQEASTKHSLDSLSKIAQKVDSVYRIDTLRLTHTTTVYTERRDTVLEHLTDTLVVKEFVQAADSVVKACSLLQLTCAQRHSVDSATAAGWERIATAERKAKPSVVLTTGKLILAGLAGVVVGHSLK